MRCQKTRKTIFSIIVAFFLGSIFCCAGFAKNEIEFIPGEDSGFFYIIKKGDTLWDLSEKFYNSEWDWPALWQMNDEIKNPHWIYPGRKIRIFFKEKDKLKPIIVKVKRVEKKPVPEKIKPSFSYAQMDRVGFIRKTQQVSLGSIIKETNNKLAISKDDVIFIKPSGDTQLVPNEKYHVFSTDNIKENIGGNEFTGIKHQINATIKILSREADYAKAVVTESFRTVRSGDMIMPYFDRKNILTVEDAPPKIDARLICSEEKTLMINDYLIAFMDIGKERVKPGEMYTVFRTNETKDYSLWKPKKKKGIKLEDVQAGKLIILHTEDISSTVMILSSEYAIHPNDMIK